MPSPYALYYVTDPTISFAENQAVIQRWAPFLTMVQLREKKVTEPIFLQRALALKAQLSTTSISLIINDNLNIALASDADGLHIGQSDGCVHKIRTALGKDKYLGLTVETHAQLQQAQSLPIDYLGISSVFATDTKNDIKHIWGWDGLTWAIAHSQKPLIAIGGIQLKDIKPIFNMGCDGVAMASAMSQQKDPARYQAYFS